MMKTFPEFPESSQSEKILLITTEEFSLPINEIDLKKIAEVVEEIRSVRFSSVEIAYVSEDEIVRINQEYLERDYVTDIISFRYDEDDDRAIEGTLYCCAPRISEQSIEYESDERTEFLRVAAHGLLHLTGLDDQTEEDKENMTRLENSCLEKFSEES